ncbi:MULTISPECIES: enoyl-CoA hydratase [Brevibacterium]|jgi:enoyl-CoA hydratase/carnithine racemase|uniref:Enoyl-CoA hydratase domain-containing protein 3, mitochondrial n=1 Tax=Brevibacterium salitolerans TaxID=1403566 RepID=A0ABN2WPR1_9MICO|nr:enoyl-CoA hydratase [Brevibacterium sp.]
MSDLHSTDLLTIQIRGAVVTLTLASPATRNALSTTLMTQLRDTLETVGERTDLHAVVLAAEGHVFSSGHDLKEIRGASHARQQEIFDLCADLMLTVQRIPQPVIAQVQGLATAAGAQLVATCDLAVAAETASFATPGVRIGLFCSTPGVAIARALPTKQAMRMLLTGDALTAQQALAHGLVSDVVPAEELVEAAQALAEKVAEASSATVALGKAAFYRQLSMSTPEAYAAMAATMAENAVLPDAQEGIDAFLTKRTPTWQGREASDPHAGRGGFTGRSDDREDVRGQGA